MQANPEKYGNATVATEAMLTPDMLTITLASTVGVNASKQFAKNASIQKVSASIAGLEEEENENEGGSGNESENQNQGGGSQNGGGSNQGGGGTGTIDTGGNGGNTGGNGGSTDPDDGDEG
ncbi:MAG: hypothetical protein K6G70_02425 [Bacteroidaceae bacterium]|nr:hypothetical protein [Bacteroidaceae bacterium]